MGSRHGCVFYQQPLITKGKLPMERDSKADVSSNSPPSERIQTKITAANFSLVFNSVEKPNIRSVIFSTTLKSRLVPSHYCLWDGRRLDQEWIEKRLKPHSCPISSRPTTIKWRLGTSLSREELCGFGDLQRKTSRT